MSFQLKSLAFVRLCVTLLLSLPAFAQTTIIEGVVKDPTASRCQGAVVDIERTDIKGSYTVKTDKKGHYGHYGLPMGEFDVSVLVDGQVKDAIKGVPTTPAMPVELRLRSQSPAGGCSWSGSSRDPGSRGKGHDEGAEGSYEKANKAREEQLAKNKELNDAYTAGRAALDAKMYDAAIEAFKKPR